MRSPTALITRRGAAHILALGASALVLGVAATPADAAVPACRKAQLVTWLDTQSNGAAGTIFYTLNFTNLGAKCTLRGYPGVSAVGRAGQQLGKAAVRNSIKPVKTVTLNAPNASHGTFSTVHATLGIVDTGVFSQSACAPTIASGLRVFAPNQPAATVDPFPFGACARSGPKFLTISAVAK
jgi:Protein of unknown function (DUF4232)